MFSWDTSTRCEKISRSTQGILKTKEEREWDGIKVTFLCIEFHCFGKLLIEQVASQYESFSGRFQFRGVRRQQSLPLYEVIPSQRSSPSWSLQHRIWLWTSVPFDPPVGYLVSTSKTFSTYHPGRTLSSTRTFFTSIDEKYFGSRKKIFYREKRNIP